MTGVVVVVVWLFLLLLLLIWQRWLVCLIRGVYVCISFNQSQTSFDRRALYVMMESFVCFVGIAKIPKKNVEFSVY